MVFDMNGWTFEHPYVFVLVVLYALCLRWCPARFERLRFPWADRFAALSSRAVSLRRLLQTLLFVLLVTALASPVVEDEIVAGHDEGYEISLVLDASGSMAQDNKFGIVKSIVEQFVRQRPHDKIGLTIFADLAYVAVPLTYDKTSLLRLLDKLEVGVAGTRRTALCEALFLSTKLFAHSHAKNKVAILLTDGMDNTGSVPMQVAIDTAKRFGIKVYTIGVGAAGDFDPYVLRKIAEATGGRFFQADSARKLQAIYAEIDKLEKSEFKAERHVRKSYYYMWPLAAALVLMLVLAARRGGVA